MLQTTKLFRIGFLLLIIASALLLKGCAANRYAKKAAKFEEAGLYKDAAELYYESVAKNPTKVEPKLGLRKNGQLVLNDLLTQFDNDYKHDDTEKAVYSYKKAKNYFDKLANIGVDLSFPEEYHGQYNDVKNSFLSVKYADGLEKNQRKEYDKAAEIFKEIVAVSPHYKDVDKQLTIATYEPLYEKATKLFYGEKPRAAYWLFNQIEKETKGYKEAQNMKDKAREKATLNILVAPIEASKSGSKALGYVSVEQVTKSVNTLKNPFLRIVDQEAIDPNILKKKNGGYNIQALNLAGVNTIMIVDIINANWVKGKTIEKKEPAYIKKIKYYKDGQGKKQKKVLYSKTTYKSYKKTNTAFLEISYKYIDTETGQVILANSFTKKKKDVTHFGRYRGNINDLVPGYWKNKQRKSPEDRIDDNYAKIHQLRKLLQSSDQIKEVDALLKKAAEESILQIANAINKYNPEK